MYDRLLMLKRDPLNCLCILLLALHRYSSLTLLVFHVDQLIELVRTCLMLHSKNIMNTFRYKRPTWCGDSVYFHKYTLFIWDDERMYGKWWNRSVDSLNLPDRFSSFGVIHIGIGLGFFETVGIVECCRCWVSRFSLEIGWCWNWMQRYDKNTAVNQLDEISGNRAFLLGTRQLVRKWLSGWLNWSSSERNLWRIFKNLWRIEEFMKTAIFLWKMAYVFR